MKYFQTIFIPILIAVLAFCMLAFQLSMILHFTFLQGDFYISIFKKYSVYSYIKEYALNMVKENLADSEQSLPYLKEALSEEWMEKEINQIVYGFFDFLEGRQKNLPEISGKSIKERLALILKRKGIGEPEKYVQFWLPIPDTVRLSDITSTKELWEIRVFYHWMSRLPFILGFAVMLPMVAIIIVSTNTQEGYLWALTGLIGGGALAVLVGVMGLWMVNTSLSLQEAAQQFSPFGIPVKIFKSILWTGLSRTIYLTIISGFVCSGVGSFMWMRWQER